LHKRQNIKLQKI